MRNRIGLLTTRKQHDNVNNLRQYLDKGRENPHYILDSHTPGVSIPTVQLTIRNRK